MKEPSRIAYAEAAHLLMEASPRGETTTLEVKRLLRFLKFHVKQVDVSEAMATLESECGWQVDHVEERGHQFKVFSLNPPNNTSPVFSFR